MPFGVSYASTIYKIFFAAKILHFLICSEKGGINHLFFAEKDGINWVVFAEKDG